MSTPPGDLALTEPPEELPSGTLLLAASCPVWVPGEGKAERRPPGCSPPPGAATALPSLPCLAPAGALPGLPCNKSEGEGHVRAHWGVCLSTVGGPPGCPSLKELEAGEGSKQGPQDRLPGLGGRFM